MDSFHSANFSTLLLLKPSLNFNHSELSPRWMTRCCITPRVTHFNASFAYSPHKVLVCFLLPFCHEDLLQDGYLGYRVLLLGTLTLSLKTLLCKYPWGSTPPPLVTMMETRRKGANSKQHANISLAKNPHNTHSWSGNATLAPKQ